MPEGLALVIRRVAKLEIDDAAKWYEARVRGLGIRFVEEVTTCFELIRTAPGRYPVVHREIRRALLKQFPYAVYFVRRGESVIVLGCSHTRRDPNHWRNRP